MTFGSKSDDRRQRRDWGKDEVPPFMFGNILVEELGRLQWCRERGQQDFYWWARSPLDPNCAIFSNRDPIALDQVARGERVGLAFRWTGRPGAQWKASIIWPREEKRDAPKEETRDSQQPRDAYDRRDLSREREPEREQPGDRWKREPR